MVQPTALNFVVVGLMVIIFNFMWKMTSTWLVDKNPESQLARAMAAIND